MLAYLSDVRASREGYAVLAALNEALQRAGEKTITIDFSTVRWLAANMAAPLGAIVASRAHDGFAIKYENIKPVVRRILHRNGFLMPSTPDTYQTTIPYKVFGVESAKQFAEYTDKYLRGKGIPAMSEQLRKKFLEGLDELFNNAAVHSRTSCGIFACGQAFPAQHRVVFSICDAGTGIRENLRRELGLRLSAEAAIDWAMSDENTTKQGDLPGGLGLKILREFVKLNEGSIIVVSDNGYWSLQQGRVSAEPLGRTFPGTAVNVEINTRDPSIYYFASETDPNSLL